MEMCMQCNVGVAWNVGFDCCFLCCGFVHGPKWWWCGGHGSSLHMYQYRCQTPSLKHRHCGKNGDLTRRYPFYSFVLGVCSHVDSTGGLSSGSSGISTLPTMSPGCRNLLPKTNMVGGM